MRARPQVLPADTRVCVHARRAHAAGPGEAAAPPSVEAALGAALGAQPPVVLQVAVPQQLAQHVQELVEGELVVLVLVGRPEQLTDEVRLPPALRKGGRSAAAPAAAPQDGQALHRRWRGLGRAGARGGPASQGLETAPCSVAGTQHAAESGTRGRAGRVPAPRPGLRRSQGRDRRCRRRPQLQSRAERPAACRWLLIAKLPCGDHPAGGFSPAAPQGRADLPCVCTSSPTRGQHRAGPAVAGWDTCQGLFVTPRPPGRVQDEARTKPWALGLSRVSHDRRP